MKHTAFQLPALLLTIVMSGGLFAFVNTYSHADRPDKQAKPEPATVDRTAVAQREAEQSAARQAEREAALTRIEKRLAQADREAAAAAEQCLAPMRELFKQARQGSRPFAEKALSFSSKWRLMVDYLPGTRGDRHENYMRTAFEQHIFPKNQLARQLEAVIAEFQRVQQDIENQVLVDVGVDLESLKLQTTPPPSKEELQKRIVKLLEQATSDVKSDVSLEVLQFAASEVAAHIAVNVATRLGVSSAIIGTGASASWATLGASLAVGVLIDWIVTEIWYWWADPVGELAAKVDSQLATLQTELIDGPKGLKQTFSAAVAKRNELRQQAVLQALEDWAK